MTTLNKDNSDLYVIGVGASAGGLNALTAFLKNFNGVKSDICIVIVMHLSPNYKSQLAPILNKRCRWPVITVINDVNLESGNIYVTPQNKQIQVQNNALVLEELDPKYSFSPSVDHFFKSLARAKGKKAIGIILSGFGKDGSKGISEISKHGGLTIAQLPETAEHKDMPKYAIETGDVNIILPAEEIYDDLVQYVNNSQTIASSPSSEASIDAIFVLLEKRSGTDFSMYKPSTIMRRINHRIATLKLKSVMEYHELINKNPRELDNLFDTVLIGVTEFFRDLEAYDALKENLEKLLDSKQVGDTIRIWSVGCATGEEPYSIAILLHELLGNTSNKFQIQIFASDIDERAINFGRKGIYHKELLGNVPAEIVSKYFTKKNDSHYEVNKFIKQNVLFTRHDITNDPPFVKLDLVTCRNLLIYFNNILQKQCFQIFHYALKPNGLLFLGKSESISVVTNLFSKIGKNKLFKKSEASLNYQLKFSRFRSKSENNSYDQNKSKHRDISIADVAKDSLYHKYEHPFVIINSHSEIKEVKGSLRLYLEISEGSMNTSIHKMINPELVVVLKAILANVKKTGIVHTSHVVKFKLYNQNHYVRLKVIPFVYRINEEQYYIIIFEKTEPSEGQLELHEKLETADFENLRIKKLEDELNSTKEHLQVFTEELEATNEELQTMNEELQSSNEELKSSNEELETSNEELQSANEELNTANQELRLTNDLLLDKEQELKTEKEKSQRNERIYRTIAENLPDSIVGILDKKLHIEYITGKALSDQDLEDLKYSHLSNIINSKKERKRIEKLCKQTFKGKAGHIELQDDKRYFELKTALFQLPFEDEDKILFLMQEITSNKLRQFILARTIEISKLLVIEYNFEDSSFNPKDQLSDYLQLEDNEELDIKTIKGKIHENDLPEVKRQLKKSLKTGIIENELRITVSNKIRHIRITGKILFGEKNKPLKAYIIILDISKDKELLEQAKASEQRFRTLANTAPMSIWITDREGICTYINKAWLNFTGSTEEENLGDGWANFVHPDDVDRCLKIMNAAFEGRQPYHYEYRVKKANGDYHWFLTNAIPRFNSENEFIGYIGSVSDIETQKEIAKDLERKVNIRTSEIREANKELISLNMNLEEFAYVASHDLKEPLRKIRIFNSLLNNATDNKEKVLEISNKIEASATRMTNLINNILNYSTVEKNAENKEEVFLDNIVNQVKSDLAILLEEQKAIIEIEDELGHVSGVPTRIYQLFSNLIRNAIKFNKNKPKIIISSEIIKGESIDPDFNAEPHKSFKSVSFKDNGIGIELEKKDYIFKPFKRLHSSSNFAGTGIGLAICKRIMNMHNGYINVINNAEEGSTFALYFPINE